ncbi:hypothetical protein BSKO_04496 [Bryopsis sp. KO-2023]|nr:hypothetical protein BSKO_04496 [Bryopsis sp. KO-2023]
MGPRFVPFALAVLVSVVGEAVSAETTFVSQSGAERCEFSERLRPSSVVEIQNIVKKARDNGQKVKAVGTRHSSSDINCAGGIALDLSNIASIKVDPKKMRATVGAGATHETMLNALQEQGYSVIHPSMKFSGLSIGGTLATGAHGSSLVHPASISDQVVSLTLVDGQGRVRKITGEKLKAVNVNIGVLGVVVTVTIKIVKNYKVKLEYVDNDESILFDGRAIEWARNQDYLEMSWFPSTKKVVALRGTYVDINTPGDGKVLAPLTITPETVALLEQASAARDNAFFCGAEAAARNVLAFGKNGTPQSFNSKGEYSSSITGVVKDVLSSFCAAGTCAWDNPGPKFLLYAMEFAFDLETLPRALQAVRNIIDKRRWCAVSSEAIQIRFQRKTDNYISFSNGRDAGIVTTIVPLRQKENSSHYGTSALQEIHHTMLLEFKGRPHWGKNARATFADPFPTVSEIYPEWNKFIGVKEELDPEGVFENDFFRRLTRQQELPKFKYCAVKDKCVCSESSHCADGQFCEPLVIGGRDVGVCVDSF